MEGCVSGPHPRLVELARSVLTDTEYLTWAMAQRGITQRDIAFMRRRSLGTVSNTLIRAERKIEEAQRAAYPNP
jgi:transcriptional regulator